MIINHKKIQWNDSQAIMYIIEENKAALTEITNPHLTNDQYKLIMSQYASELKSMLGEISKNIEISSQNKDLKNQIDYLSSLMQEIVSIITFDGENVHEEEKAEFTLDSIFTEILSTLRSKLTQKGLGLKVDIQLILKEVKIRAQKSTIKQVLLPLITNAMSKMTVGDIKVSFTLSEEDKSIIKVSIEDEAKSVGFEEARRINGALSGKDTNQATERLEALNLSNLKVLCKHLGGKLWIISDNGIGNKMNFTFRVDNDDLEYSFIEDIEFSDSGNEKYSIKSIPCMACNYAPFADVPLIEEVVELEEEKDCWPDILLVDDNYFNIEVLESLIQVQLRMDCDSAFNGLEAFEKVKERSEKKSRNNYFKYIFMDVNMPIMDGYEASAEIKSFLKNKESKNPKIKFPTKIFAITAQKEVIENKQMLFDGIILKPISIEGLRNVLG